VAIAATAHQLEIQAAELALTRTKNPEVKAFAEMMIKDHGEAAQQGKDLLAKLAMEPKENAESTKMVAEAKVVSERLGALSGAEFDKAYVEAMVLDHQKVLDGLDGQLIPNADHADLKAHLAAVKPVVAAHLDHAKKLADKLK
jgi:putative membrane protein